MENLLSDNSLDENKNNIKNNEVGEYLYKYKGTLITIILEDGIDIKSLTNLSGFIFNETEKTENKLKNLGDKLIGLENNGLHFLIIPNTMNGLKGEITDDMEMLEIYNKESKIVKNHVNIILSIISNAGLDSYVVNGLEGTTGYFREEFKLKNVEDYIKKIVENTNNFKLPIIPPLINDEYLIDPVLFSNHLSIKLNSKKMIIPTNELLGLSNFSMLSVEFIELIIKYKEIDNIYKKDELLLLLKDYKIEDILDIIDLDYLTNLLNNIILTFLGKKYLLSAIDFIKSNIGNRVHFIKYSGEISDEILNIDGANQSTMISNKNDITMECEGNKYHNYYVLRH